MLNNELEDLSLKINVIKEMMYTIVDFIDSGTNEENIELTVYELKRKASQATRISNGAIQLLEISEEKIDNILKNMREE